MSEIDGTLYMRAPQADVPTTVALGISLLSAVPKGAPSQVKGAAKKLRTSVLALQSAWGQAAAVLPTVSRRAADAATDNAWGCLEGRLSAYSRLPAPNHPKARRAQEIHEALFGDGGLEFLTRAYKAQWAEGEKRLALIDDSGYAADIDELAGPEFLAEVRSTHKAYGKALSITQAETPSPDASLIEPLREASRRVVGLALQLIAWAADDDQSTEAVRRALKPIDDLRAASARRQSPPVEPAAEPPAPPAATPTTTIPDVPA
ncbi:MAG: hypothetical protein R3B70_13145 [Polyangiaceae bacterium]